MDTQFYQWLYKQWQGDPNLNRNIQILKLRNSGQDYYTIAKQYHISPSHCGRIYTRFAKVYDYIYQKVSA